MLKRGSHQPHPSLRWVECALCTHLQACRRHARRGEQICHILYLSQCAIFQPSRSSVCHLQLWIASERRSELSRCNISQNSISHRPVNLTLLDITVKSRPPYRGTAEPTQLRKDLQLPESCASQPSTELVAPACHMVQNQRIES